MIERTAVVRGQHGEMFRLVLKKPDSTSRRRFWRRSNELDVILPVDDLVASGDEFRELLERYLADTEARRAIGFEREPMRAAS